MDSDSTREPGGDADAKADEERRAKAEPDADAKENAKSDRKSDAKIDAAGDKGSDEKTDETRDAKENAKSDSKIEAAAADESKASKDEKRARDEDEERTAEAKDAHASDSKSRQKEQPTMKSRRSTGSAGKIFRFAYWVVWFLVVPFCLACAVVWALTPSAGLEPQGILAWAESIVREQPVPVGIVLFTVFEMSIWAARHRLPLASFVHSPLRPGVPEELRGAFERARALVEEARAIEERYRAAVVRDLSAKERAKLTSDIEALERTMDAEPFDEQAFADAIVRADGEVDLRLGRWRKSEFREYAESILVAIGVALMLRTFVIEAFKIPSGSMIPTLQIGDHIFVNKFSYGPAIPWMHARLWTHMPPDRGDVMVFAYPEHPEQDFIKRVIALPGDELRARAGHPIINGWEVPSCFVGIYSYTELEPPTIKHDGDLYVEYLEDEAYLTLYDHIATSSNEAQGPFYVEPGQVYVMGDNRNNSHDSRLWFNDGLYRPGHPGIGGGVPFENIRGRALFVWWSLTEAGVDWTRLGAPVMGRPRLPPAMKALEPAMNKCLRERPSIDKTTPPRPPAR